LREQIGEGPRATGFGRFQSLLRSAGADQQNGQLLENVLTMIDERHLAHIAGHVGAQIVDDSRARPKLVDRSRGISVLDRGARHRAPRSPLELGPAGGSCQ